MACVREAFKHLRYLQCPQNAAERYMNKRKTDGFRLHAQSVFATFKVFVGVGAGATTAYRTVDCLYPT